MYDSDVTSNDDDSDFKWSENPHTFSYLDKFLFSFWNFILIF